MQKRTNVATLSDLGKQKTTGRMTVGIDLGDRRCHFCVLNDQAQVIASGSLPTTATVFRREFAALPPSLIAIEAGAHSLWVNQVLKLCGHEVLVGNPRKIRLITESDRKSDRADAQNLARGYCWHPFSIAARKNKSSYPSFVPAMSWCALARP